MMCRRIVLCSVLVLSGASLPAQVIQRGPGAGRRVLQRVMPQQDPTVLRRRAIEQQIRQRLWQVTKRNLSLSDEQMIKLEQVSARFDQRRRQLGQQERLQRQALRTEILADSSANQTTIANALDQLHQIQHQRIDLQVEEQKEFAAFMTPLQRAKFMALQEEFRKRLQELVRSRADSAPAPALQSP